ncbi:MAG: hypothetical protein ACR2KQ_10325 [Actinomycetota bacterium]
MITAGGIGNGIGSAHVEPYDWDGGCRVGRGYCVHYFDNYLNVAEYPQPEWITGGTVLLSWVFFTLLGIAGYLLYRAGQTLAAGLYLLAYSLAGLTSPGHYLHGALEEFSLKMHLGIWADAVVGTAVAVCGVLVLLQGRAISRAD